MEREDELFLENLLKEHEEDRKRPNITRRHEEHENPFDGSRPLRDSIDFGPEKYKEKFGDFSDFTVFPSEYFCAAEENTRAIENELIEEADANEASFKEEGTDLLLDQIKPSVGHYFHIIRTKYYWKTNLIFTLIGAIIGFVLAIKGVGVPEQNVHPIVTILFVATVGFTAGLVGRPVYGTILGFVLFPIAYPVYLGIVKLVNNKRDKKNDAIYDTYNDKIQGNVDDYTKRIESLRERFEKRIYDYYTIFEEKAETIYEKFKESELISPIVDWAAERFLTYVNNVSCRSARVDRVLTSLRLDFYKDTIQMSILDILPRSDSDEYVDEFNFNEQRYQKLPDAVTQTALAVAVTRAICKKIREMQKIDKDGAKYNIHPAYYYPTIETDDNDDVIYNEDDFKDACIRSALTYSANNPNYKSLKSW